MSKSSSVAQAHHPGQSGPSLRRGLHVPTEVLIAIFVIVEALIIWLMAPQFVREYTRWKSIRYASRGNYQAASVELQKLLKTPNGANNPTYLAELGNCYYNLGDFDKSLEYFKKAQDNRMNVEVTDADSDTVREYADFNTMIGLCYYRKGELEKAEDHFKKGLEANKLDKVAHMKLGEIEFQRGNLLKAVEYFKFVARDPHYEKAVREYYQKIEAELFKGIDETQETTASQQK